MSKQKNSIENASILANAILTLVIVIILIAIGYHAIRLYFEKREKELVSIYQDRLERLLYEQECKYKKELSLKEEEAQRDKVYYCALIREGQLSIQEHKENIIKLEEQLRRIDAKKSIEVEAKVASLKYEVEKEKDELRKQRRQYEEMASRDKLREKGGLPWWAWLNDHPGTRLPFPEWSMPFTKKVIEQSSLVMKDGSSKIGLIVDETKDTLFIEVKKASICAIFPVKKTEVVKHTKKQLKGDISSIVLALRAGDIRKAKALMKDNTLYLSDVRLQKEAFDKHWPALMTYFRPNEIWTYIEKSKEEGTEICPKCHGAKVPCKICNGKGSSTKVITHTSNRCETCKGTGTVQERLVYHNGGGSKGVTSSCRSCGGTGIGHNSTQRSISTSCHACEGTGSVPVDCYYCNGTGYVKKDNNLIIKLGK